MTEAKTTAMSGLSEDDIATLKNLNLYLSQIVRLLTNSATENDQLIKTIQQATERSNAIIEAVAAHSTDEAKAVENDAYNLYDFSLVANQIQQIRDMLRKRQSILFNTEDIQAFVKVLEQEYQKPLKDVMTNVMQTEIKQQLDQQLQHYQMQLEQMQAIRQQQQRDHQLMQQVITILVILGVLQGIASLLFLSHQNFLMLLIGGVFIIALIGGLIKCWLTFENACGKKQQKS